MQVNEIPNISSELESRLISIREHLHANPELSFKEFNTVNFVIDQLKFFGIDKIERVATTGVMATIEGQNPNTKCIALRGDMDALPIQETNQVHYRSKEAGVMHACGHDVHTTCLLGAAHLLFITKDKWNGTIKLLFQPGEEKSPGGASIMIEDGVLENPKVDAIIGLHVAPDLNTGTAGFRTGAYMASADEIHIKVIGKSGHAAMPHLTIDPIMISAQLINTMQLMLTRSNDPMNPSVLSFGKIEGGTTTNVIPNEVNILGTFRTFNEEWRVKAKDLISTICNNFSKMYGAKIAIDIPPGYPYLNNDYQVTNIVREAAKSILGKENIIDLPMRMSSEDFSFYTHKIPGTFFRLGTNKNHNKYTDSVHTSTFDIDSDAIAIGTKLMAAAAVKILSQEN